MTLDAATNLGLGTASFITAKGAASGGDTITALRLEKSYGPNV